MNGLTTGHYSLSGLLQQWKIVTAHDITHARASTVQVGLPLGLVLVMEGLIEPQILHAVISCQSMLRDKVIGVEEAAKAIEVVRKNNVSLTVALDLLSVELKKTNRNRLGDLLLESQAVDRDTLKRALSICKVTCLPLGRVLLGLGDISTDLLGRALSLQGLIRSGKETREQAVEKLHNARKVLQVLSEVDEQALAENTRVGDLLKMAGLLTDQEIKAAMEEAGRGNGRLGDSLVNLKLISPEVRDATIEMQRLVRIKRFGLHHSIEVLRQISGSDEGICHLMFPDQTEEQRNNVELLQFLRLVRALPGSRSLKEKEKVKKSEADDVEQTWDRLSAYAGELTEEYSNVPDEFRELMQRAGYISEEEQQSFLRAGFMYSLFRAGAVSAEHALINFHKSPVTVA